MQHSQNTWLRAALGYVVGAALIVAVLVGGAPPAHAGVTTSATCDGWSFTLDDYPDGAKTVTATADGERFLDGIPFTNGFSLGADWTGYRSIHDLYVIVALNGVSQPQVEQLATGCPTAPPPVITASVTCDGWSFALNGFSDGVKTVSAIADGIIFLNQAPFANGFSLGGDWPNYQTWHQLVVLPVDGLTEPTLKPSVTGCPASAPTTTTTSTTTTTTTPTTTAPTPTTTTTPTTTAPTPTTTTATTSTTTDPTLSATTTLASTPTTTFGVAATEAEASDTTTTFDVAATETEASDTTVVAAADTESPSNSNTAPLLVGLLVAIALAVVGRGAWYLRTRPTQN